MFSIGTHRRFRDQLSAYIDGELEAAAAERLEAHLAACEGCRLELGQLRATAAALRDLPEAEVPRSFTLSPERAAGRRPLTRATAPLALGMRLAAAGVAVALAAVFVVDLGGLAEDNEAGTAAPQAASDRGTEYGAPNDGAATPNAEGAGTPATSEELAGDRSDTGTPSQTAEVPPPAQTTGGGGIDALAAAEIGLGVTLGLLVLGGLALAFAGRKT
ncbi:MAG: zf-HC2 domain-containing protein [Dehalococcoidia bacterium]|nr:zf-HC2 domain-containing protein [Dehalococcoidia bacterium]